CSYSQIKTNVHKTEIDNLINIIPNFQGTELVDHLNLIATSISQRYPDSCLHYSNQALKLSESLKYEFGKAEAIFNFGNGYFYKFDLKNALTNYLAALRILEKFGDLDCHGNLLLQIGFINAFVGNHDKSIEYFRRAQSIFYKTGNKYAELFARRRIGAAFLHQIKKYDSALIYYNELLYEYRQLGNKWYEAYMMIELGNIFTDQKDVYKGIQYYEKTLMISEIRNTYLPGVLYGNLGYVYHTCLDKPNFLKAEAYCLDAIQVYKKTGRFEKMPDIYQQCGYIYFEMRSFNAANKFLESGLKAVTDFYASIDTLVYEDPEMKYRYYTAVKLMLSNIYDVFHIMNEEIGDHIKALYYYKLKIQSEDNIYTEANRRLTDVILANAENESISQKIELLEKEKELQEDRAQRSILFLIGSGILIVLIILIAILLIRQNKFRIEQEKTNLQQKLLRSQMNPHFIFNSLSSIQGFITEKDPRTASRYLSKFAKLIRNILDSSVEEFIPLVEEIATIENYLELQKVRYEGKFDYSIEVDENIDSETMTIPPMLAQPFIENSIEHGFKHKDEKGNIKIQFGLNGNLIRFEVEDDGVGREKAKEIQYRQDKDHRSMATDITHERLQVLNKKLRQKIILIITDLEDEKGNPAGTKVTFDIPFKS
ncbi:MAG: histidine kinase, partial [Bacteroidales bacterium]|nr:histidine kinase [Bacteroidales bacterium]